MPLDLEKTIPLGLEILETGNFTIEINNFETELNNTNIYLKDNLLQIVHDLKQSDYQFNTQEIGNIDNRFELIFSRTVLGNTSNTILKNQLIISNNNPILVKTNTNKTLKKITVFDVLGKRIFSKETNTTEVKINQNLLNENIYIFKALLENGEILTKKYLKAF